MDQLANAKFRLKDNDKNPHRRMHKVVFILVTILLTGQVIEGAFLIPYVIVHFGYPDLSLKEVCDEMNKLAYDDDSRYCEFPGPLFRFEPEPWLQANREERFGYVTPPRHHVRQLGFREVLEVRKERMAKQGGVQLSDQLSDQRASSKGAGIEQNDQGAGNTMAGEVK